MTPLSLPLKGGGWGGGCAPLGGGLSRPPPRPSPFQGDGQKSEARMAKDAIVSDELAKKFATEKDTPYTRLVRGEGLDIISAHYVPNLHTVELKPWARRGGSGVFINHDASRTSNDCYVCEIPPAARPRAAAPAVRGDDLRPRRPRLDDGVERRRRSASPSSGRRARCSRSRSTPGTSTSTARAASRRVMSPSPTRRRSSISTRTSTSCSTRSTTSSDRFNGEPDYFATKGEQKGLLLETNFVADAVNLPLDLGEGARRRRRRISASTWPRGSMNSHISQFPVGTYKKAHAHGPGAHVIILTGEGYSLMWPEGDEPRRYEWQVGLDDRAAQHVVPPALQHRHRRRRAISRSSTRRSSIRNAQGVPKAWISRGSAATRSTTPTRRRVCAVCSPRRSPSTASRRAWTRPTEAELADAAAAAGPLGGVRGCGFTSLSCSAKAGHPVTTELAI